MNERINPFLIDTTPIGPNTFTDCYFRRTCGVSVDDDNGWFLHWCQNPIVVVIHCWDASNHWDSSGRFIEPHMSSSAYCIEHAPLARAGIASAESQHMRTGAYR